MKFFKFFKKLLTTIFWVILIVLLAGVAGYFYVNSQMTTYQDDQYKFSIKYPKTWKVIPHPRKDVAVVFLRPKDTVLDTLQENVNVTVQQVPSGISTMPAFTAAIKRQMVGVFGKSIKIVDDRPLHWGWHEGHIMSLDAPEPDHLKMVNAWAIRSDQSYIVTFLGDINKFEEDFVYVYAMIYSVQLLS